MNSDTRIFLPMLGHTRGKRSPVTCALKCDNACSKAVCNTSSNGYFRDIASARFSRRAALGIGAGGVLSAAVLAAGGAAPAVAAAPQARMSRPGQLAFDAIRPVD